MLLKYRLYSCRLPAACVQLAWSCAQLPAAMAGADAWHFRNTPRHRGELGLTRSQMLGLERELERTQK